MSKTRSSASPPISRRGSSIARPRLLVELEVLVLDQRRAVVASMWVEDSKGLWEVWARTAVKTELGTKRMKGGNEKKIGRA